MKDSRTLFSLEGRVAIITGGAGMLGSQYARFLDASGARVVIFDKTKRDAALGEGVEYVALDITDMEAVRASVKRVAARFGGIDVLINNAALDAVPGKMESEQQFVPYEEYPESLWEKEIAVGLTGALYCTQAVVPFMKKQGRGSIINVASTYGLVGPDNRLYGEGKFKSIGYATVKGGVLNFTRAWATYLRGSGIRVNAITPGGVKAGQSPEFIEEYSKRTVLGRMAEPDEYNGAILFLASDASSYMTGSNLVIDGGWTAW